VYLLTIRALVFDFDGLIIDTESVEFQVWQEIYRHYGCELELKTWAVCIGTSADAFDPHIHLAQMSGQQLDRDELYKRRRTRHAELVAGLPVLPGVKAYLKGAKHLGLGVAIASSSTHEWVEGYLEERGLLPYFDHIKCSDDVERVKPAPDLYLAALSALGVPGSAAVAFEDSLHGLQAAKDAGMYCVAVPNPLTRHMSWEQADLVLNSMAELPLPQLLAKLEAKAS